jgi:hypothetical protein
MAITYDSIASTTVSTTTSSVTFNSIPSIYTDLVLMASMAPITGGSSTTYGLRFNGDTGTNYYRVTSYASSSTNGASAATGTTHILLNYSSVDNGGNGPVHLTKINIFDYYSLNRKTISWDQALEVNTSGSLVRGAGLWDSTAEITSITFYSPTSTNFQVGSTLSLYGIAKA